MAINTNTSDSSACSSPRISFSNDLQEEVEVIRLDSSLLFESNSDFNFCVTSFPEKETYCPADELFFNGMIIPTQMKQKLNSIDKFTYEEEITASTTATLIREEKTQSKSIWRFKRSSSLNCENHYYGHKKSSIWSSLPLLFRSKSTGSSSLVNSSDDYSNKTQKNSSKFSSKPNSKQSYSSHQKPPLMKTGSNGGVNVFAVNNGVRNSRVLNVPSPYIAKGTSDLLGFGTLFRNGSMDNKSKK